MFSPSLTGDPNIEPSTPGIRERHFSSPVSESTQVPINAEPSGYLPRDPEPRPRTARHMASIIPHVSADIAFALSSDMGRLSMVTETLETTSEEYTLPLIADHVLTRRPGPVVANCCTTGMLDDVAKRHGQPLFKTEVGQAYVVSRLCLDNVDTVYLVKPAQPAARG